MKMMQVSYPFRLHYAQGSKIYSYVHLLEGKCEALSMGREEGVTKIILLWLYKILTLGEMGELGI